MALFLSLLYATGGSSRMDAQSLAILRPLSIIVCAIACVTLRREHLVGRRWLLAWFGAIFVLALIHMFPLPPTFWQSLAGRQDLVDVEKLAGLPDTWRPMALAPTNGWNALISLVVPLAVGLLGIQLNRNDLFRLLPLIIALSTLSGLLGLMQVIGDPQGLLYLYKITNTGTAVGLFANRNHAATLLACLFPMLAVYASSSRGEGSALQMRQLTAAAIAIVLVPLILVTGSRSGFVGAVIGLAAAALLYRQPTGMRTLRRGTADRFTTLPIIGGVAVVSLAWLTYSLSRAEAIERMFGQENGGVGRTDFWTVSVDLIWKYFPWGSGPGSFVHAYQFAEPAGLLGTNYLNHAHNDWVEMALTFGLSGVIAMLGTLIFFGTSIRNLWRRTDDRTRTTAFARLAWVIIALIGIASVSDYPLRTPTFMGLFAILALWLTASD